MATITEDYVSFDTAKLLKEKGFNCETDMYYSPEGELKCWFPNGLKSWLDNKGNETWWWKCVAPTLQMAMRWLREVHHLVIQIELIDFLEHGEVWLYYIIERKTIRPLTGRDEDFTEHSYEQACEAALKYCLENLI